LTAQYVWQLPKLKGSNAFVRSIVNGWQTSGLVILRSGNALTLYTGQDNSLTGLNRDVPILTGNPYALGACATTTVRCKDWLNPNAFSLPTAGTDGNLVKGTLTGPRYTDWDAGLFRNITFAEKVNVQFRAEYFNLLNHTNLSDPGTTVVTTSTFGKITTANSPRVAQLSLKLSF
jgi:hypothetical protein